MFRSTTSAEVMDDIAKAEKKHANTTDPEIQHAIIIEGETLTLITEDPDL
jgi:hypothetical protein